MRFLHLHSAMKKLIFNTFKHEKINHNHMKIIGKMQNELMKKTDYFISGVGNLALDRGAEDSSH